MFVYTLLAILPLLVFGVEVLPEVDAVENGVYIPTQFSAQIHMRVNSDNYDGMIYYDQALAAERTDIGTSASVLRDYKTGKAYSIVYQSNTCDRVPLDSNGQDFFGWLKHARYEHDQVINNIPCAMYMYQTPNAHFSACLDLQKNGYPVYYAVQDKYGLTMMYFLTFKEGAQNPALFTVPSFCN